MDSKDSIAGDVQARVDAENSSCGFGFQFSVFSFQFSVFGFRFSVFGFRFSVFGFRCEV